MRKQGGGKIINLGSLSFEITPPNVALYATSKGGMRQLTRALAVEWAPENINVNAIAPGRFWTAMTDALFSDPDLYDSAAGAIPQGRPGRSVGSGRRNCFVSVRRRELHHRGNQSSSTAVGWQAAE